MVENIMHPEDKTGVILRKKPISENEEEELLENNEEYDVDEEGIMAYSPFKELAFLGRLFFSPKFFVHRVCFHY